MKKKQINQLSPNQSTYDGLLEEFLPVIHKAVYSIQKDREMNHVPKDLLLAGLRGFNDAFLTFCDAVPSDPQKAFLNTIACAMQKQLKSNRVQFKF